MTALAKAAIFDLNGVFIQSQKLSDRVFADFGVQAKEFLPVLSGIMDELRLPGARPAAECWAPFLEKWKIGLSPQQFLGYWFGGETENKEMVEFARQLKNNGFRLFALSNNFRERSEYYGQNFGFLQELFEKISYSWQTGLVKPDKRCFGQILELGLEASDCFFFDDSEKNILAAKSLGINAYLFAGVDSVKLALHQ